MICKTISLAQITCLNHGLSSSKEINLESFQIIFILKMMEVPLREVSFSQFIQYFPILPLPVVLAEENINIFSQNNIPLPEAIIQQFLYPLEAKEPDEFTEFLPCFRIAETEGFHAIVYWKGALLNYHYRIATFTKKGILIDKRTLSGTSVIEETFLKSIAVIDEDWRIRILSGISNIRESYEPGSSTTLLLELLPEGRIVEIEDELIPD